MAICMAVKLTQRPRHTEPVTHSTAECARHRRVEKLEVKPKAHERYGAAVDRGMPPLPKCKSRSDRSRARAAERRRARIHSRSPDQGPNDLKRRVMTWAMLRNKRRRLGADRGPARRQQAGAEYPPEQKRREDGGTPSRQHEPQPRARMLYTKSSASRSAKRSRNVVR